MQRVLLVLLAGCGFQSPAAGGGSTADASTSDASSADATSSGCWTIATSNPVFNVSACVAPADITDTIDVSSNTSIDTDARTSNTSGFGCVPLVSGNVCALVAKSIVIKQGITLSAHGSKPLALLGHDIDVEGTIDVASHSMGGLQAKGPAADRTDCNVPTSAAVNGGGAGGTYDSQHTDGSDEGGDGGNAGTNGSNGGKAAGSISVDSLLGGCAGAPSSGGPAVAGDTIGSHSGGAVWISADTGTLMIGSNATINASGAGGVGGKVDSGNRGGYGGGSGGLIVLQAPMITQSPNAKIFANGGGGGGGDANGTVGSAGNDPLDQRGAGGGKGAKSSPDQGGDGGQGYTAVSPTAKNGGTGSSDTSGGGGGGGGGGAIRVLSNTTIMGPNVSPVPIQLLN